MCKNKFPSKKNFFFKYIRKIFYWRKRSEQELKKRYELEKTYLKSQVSALRLNTRWAKPYLKAAQQLSSNESLGSNPALVTVFNTLLLELTLMGKDKMNVRDAALLGDLPKVFKDLKNVRNYYAIVVVDFNFRGIPNRTGQHWTMGGRAEVTFKAYSLNQDELDLFKEKYKQNDVNDAFSLIEGMTEDSLGQIQVDIDEILKEDGKKSEKEQDLNPFKALFSIFESSKEKKEKEKKEANKKMEKMKKEGPPKENYAEKYIRNYTEVEAIGNCFTVYDIYKKAHGMAAFPYSGTPSNVYAPQTEIEKIFGFNKQTYNPETR